MYNVTKRMIALMMTVVMIMTIALSAPGLTLDVSAASSKYVKSLKVKKSVTVEVGKKTTVKPTVKVVKKASKKLKVKVKNKKIAKVSYSSKTNKITIKGKKIGNTTVTVTTVAKNKNGKKLTAKIKVKVVAKKSDTTQATTTTQANTTETPTTPSPETPTTPPAEPPKPEAILVDQVVMSQSEVALLKGDKTTLGASVLPDTATNKNVTWSNSASSVVSMTTTTEGVNIVALAAGTATITATATDGSGKSASCTITVTDIVEVTTQDELDNALAKNIGKITLNATNGATYSISGNHENTTLLINGTGATITNSGTFASITLTGGNYTEDAVGNNIIVNGVADITITEDADVNILDINIPDGNKENEADKVTITNNGVLSTLNILSGGNIVVNGDSTTPIQTNISGENVKFTVNQPVNLVLTAKAELVFRSTGQNEEGGTAQSTITADTPENTPDIYGVGQYEVTYTDGSESQTILAQVSTDIPPVEDLYGFVKDAFVTMESDEEAFLSGVDVYLIPADEYEAITVDEENMTVTSSAEESGLIKKTTEENGKYSFGETASGNYYIVMMKAGYKKAVQFLAVSSDYKTAWDNETMELLGIEQSKDITGSITGIVKDAATGYGIEGLTVELRINKGVTVGDKIITATTDADGYYTLETENGLLADQYTIRVVDNRSDASSKYISKAVNICVKSSEATEQNIITSTSISGDSIRFVLSWGTEESGAPSDLDAHLYGPRISGNGTFHVYYGNKQYGIGTSDVYTQLDVDDTEFEGPETITIEKPINGNYYLYINNYDGSDFDNSSAKVDVYSGDKLLTTYNVPITKDNSYDWWKVCSYNSTTKKLTSYNTLLTESEYDSDDVFTGTEALVSVSSSNEEYLKRVEAYGDSISLYANATWSLLKDTLIFDAFYDYTATFEESGNQDSSKGTITVKQGDTTIETYNIYYYMYGTGYLFTTTNEAITKYYNYSDSLYLYGKSEWSAIDTETLAIESTIEGVTVSVEWLEDVADTFDFGICVGTISLTDDETNEESEQISIYYENVSGKITDVNCSNSSLLQSWYTSGDVLYLTGSVEWTDIKDLLIYTVDTEYTIGYEAAPEDSSYVAAVNVLDGEDVVRQYNISYTVKPNVIITAPENVEITRIRQSDDYIYVYSPSTIDLSQLTYTSSIEGYTCVYTYGEEKSTVTLSNEDDSYTYYLYNRNNCYITDVTGDGIGSWFEYSARWLDILYNDEYVDDETLLSSLEITVLDGYTVEREGYNITIKDAEGLIVATKKIDIYSEDEW